MRCAILQPSYIPWRGYFDIIRRVDVFVFYDDVQYDRRGWRNRNVVKSPTGPHWLTIPVRARNNQLNGTPIHRIETDGDRWASRHLSTLQHLYGRAPYFNVWQPWLKRIYAAPPPLLADFTIPLTIEMCAHLGIHSTRFIRSSELGQTGRKTERLINILKCVGAREYLSGPSARDYIDEEAFSRAGISLEWMEYDYPEYPQLHPPYDAHVSVLDLLFMTGTDAPKYFDSSIDTPPDGE